MPDPLAVGGDAPRSAPPFPTVAAAIGVCGAGGRRRSPVVAIAPGFIRHFYRQKRRCCQASAGRVPTKPTDFLASAIREAWGQPFRGEIYEFAGGLNLQAGYSVKGFFDINSAPWVKEPFEAIRDPRVRVVSIQAGVQCLKSFIEDATIPYWILHDPGDCLFLLDTDPKALKYCSSRLMPLIRSVSEIQRLLQDVDLHDKTKTKIKFHGMNLVVGGLNEGNCQSLTYRYVVVDE